MNSDVSRLLRKDQRRGHRDDAFGQIPTPTSFPTNVSRQHYCAEASKHNTSSSLCKKYKSFIQRHQSKLLFWESCLDRLLWWYPGQSEGSIWRQLLWSLAELQHLAIHLALEPDVGNGCTLDDDNINNNIGTLPYRVALTILHNLWPVLYDRLQPNPRRHFAFWEYQLEQLWFVAQLFILGAHWGRILENFP